MDTDRSRDLQGGWASSRPKTDDGTAPIGRLAGSGASMRHSSDRVLRPEKDKVQARRWPAGGGLADGGGPACSFSTQALSGPKGAMLNRECGP